MLNLVIVYCAWHTDWVCVPCARCVLVFRVPEAVLAKRVIRVVLDPVAQLVHLDSHPAMAAGHYRESRGQR